MSIELNHTIVNVRDKKKSAKFFTELFGLPPAKPFGAYFLTVDTSRVGDMNRANDASMCGSSSIGYCRPTASGSRSHTFATTL